MLDGPVRGRPAFDLDLDVDFDFDLDFDFDFDFWRSWWLAVLSLVEPFLTSPPRFHDGGVRSGTAEPVSRRVTVQAGTTNARGLTCTVSARAGVGLCGCCAGAVGMLPSGLRCGADRIAYRRSGYGVRRVVAGADRFCCRPVNRHAGAGPAVWLG